MEPDKRPACKIVMLGNSGVGKTSLIGALCLGEKAGPEYFPTIGLDTHVYRYQDDGQSTGMS
jgi:GTPase SAR1 family protein